MVITRAKKQSVDYLDSHTNSLSDSIHAFRMLRPFSNLKPQSSIPLLALA